MKSTIYSPDNFPYNKIRCKTVRKHKITYLNIPAAFDIETTSIYCKKRRNCGIMHMKGKCIGEKCKNYIEPYAYMYIWQVCIGGYICIGRTWDEYILFIKNLTNELELSKYRRIVFYVHNLAFEFQFLKSFFDFTEVFARESRKPIKAVAGGIEYRCSYILTNMSLAKAAENTEGCDIEKKVGDLDYNKIRTPSTPLTSKELDYCIYDVKVLCKIIECKLKEDSITTIPLTSTGYVRRDFKEAYQSNPKNKQKQRNDALTPKVYTLLKEEFRGGNTHANYIYANEELTDLISYDIASSYPYVMMAKKYPRKFISAKPRDFATHLKKGYALLFRAKITGLEFTGTHNIPYIPLSKIRNFDRKKVVVDNGRIMSCPSLEITLNDIDYRIIRKHYKYEKLEISDLYIAKYEYLPKECRETILKYFQIKTTLKSNPTKEYEYVKSKNRLNSGYGMMVTDITNDEIIYEDGEWSSSPSESLEKLLQKYYKNPQTFLSYQAGVWVPAWARYRHYEFIEAIGSDMVYGDTDSIKAFDTEAVRAVAEKLNKETIQEIAALDIKPHVKHNGKDYYMGIWELEKHYDKFKTLGAKKYLVKCEDKIEVTVAGLSKEVGNKEIAKKGFSEFKIGKTFYPSGRLNGKYNDKSIHYIKVNGETIKTGSNLALYPGAYTLGVTEEYLKLIT